MYYLQLIKLFELDLLFAFFYKKDIKDLLRFYSNK